MKMGNKLYSPKLMSEAVRQVKLPGIIGLVLISGMTFFSTFIRMYDTVSYNAIIVLNRAEVSIYSLLVMYVVAPLMAMMLFGFMNRRRASDFYHSLPYSRLCIYISYMAAIFLWCFIIIASSFLITVGTTLVSHKLQLDYSSAVRAVVSALSGCVLTMSVTVLAMTLTGTYLTNVITALVILFVPRGMILVCSRILSDSLPFVVLSDSSFFGNQGNIPFILVEYLVSGLGLSDDIRLFTSFKPAVYSCLLGLIYAAVGAVCFVKRKSENATQASINRGLQCIFRMIPSILISLISISVMYNVHISGSAVSDYNKFIVIMTYVACVAAYFLYEIITTRTVRKLYRTIPGLLVVFAINAVMYFSLCFSYDYHISQLPDKQELEYVVVHGPDDNVFWQDTKNMKLYSEATRTVASDCLKDTVNLWLNNRTGQKGYYNQFYSGNMIVEYHYMNGKSITRRVIVNETRYAQLQRALTNESSFVSCFGKSIFDAEQYILYVGDIDSDGSGAERLFDTFAAELKGKGIADYFNIIDGRRSADSIFQISLVKKSGGYSSTAYIGFDMPRTLAAYMNELNRENPGDACDAFVKTTDDIKKAKNENADININSSIFFNLYTYMPDGSVEKVSANSYAYNDEYGYEMLSDEGLSYIAQIGELINEKNVNVSDIKAGTSVLIVHYYKDLYSDSGNVIMDSENMQSSNVNVHACYLVDKSMAELIKKLSRAEIINEEK